jgi:hypothetical protein
LKHKPTKQEKTLSVNKPKTLEPFPKKNTIKEAGLTFPLNLDYKNGIGNDCADFFGIINLVY